MKTGLILLWLLSGIVQIIQSMQNKRDLSLKDTLIVKCEKFD